MNVSDYVFNVGDEVITIDGERGYITSICNCVYCRERGFFEPTWADEDGDPCDIISVEAEGGFSCYYKIGNYRFNPFNKDGEFGVKAQVASAEGWLARLKKRLALIEELEELEALEKED